MSFVMSEIAHAEVEGDGGFTFAIPARAEWAEALATITLTGPDGSVTLAGDDPSSPAAALVPDAATGRIRAILRGAPVQAVAADGAGPLGTAGTVTVFSRGIPDAPAWRR